MVLSVFFDMQTYSYASTIAPFVEDTFFFPLYNFSFLVKNQVFIGVWINVQVLDLMPLVNLSVLMPVPSCFHYYTSILELDVRDGDASGSSFIVQDSFGYPVFFFIFFLFYHMKLNIALLRSVKNLVWILMGIALNL